MKEIIEFMGTILIIILVLFLSFLAIKNTTYSQPYIIIFSGEITKHDQSVCINDENCMDIKDDTDIEDMENYLNKLKEIKGGK